MNVWKALKPYLLDFLYVELPYELSIKVGNCTANIKRIEVSFLRRLDDLVLGCLSFNKIRIGSRRYNMITISSENINDFWHLLGFVYKKLNVVRREKQTPLNFYTPYREKAEFLRKFIQKFEFPFVEIRKKRLSNNKVLYGFGLPRYLTYISKRFLKMSSNKDYIKRFLSECIGRSITKNGQVLYYISLSKDRYEIYGSLDRFLNILGIKYSKREINQQNRGFSFIHYYIHSKSRPLAEEIYNMSIFREIRRRT